MGDELAGLVPPVPVCLIPRGAQVGSPTISTPVGASA
jgi:hypothetical protein